MINKKREITLLVLGILIVIVGTLRISSAYMRPNITTDGPTEITLNNCAKINLVDESQSINLTNTAPMSDNVGLLQTPYKFSIESSCNTSIRFKLYLAPLSTNTLSASSIKYAIKEQGKDKVLKTGNLTEEGVNDFSDTEKTEVNTSLGTTITSVYTIYSNFIIANTKKNYELYLWVDGTLGNEVKTKTFNASLLAKGGEEYTPTLASVCQGENMAQCMKENYELDDTLYYHDSTLANGAGDNSYRYAGPSDAVNNFVCFGTDAETCPNDNLYRIIGVFDDKIKLIKYDYATSELLGTDGDYSSDGDPTASYYKGSMTKIPYYYWNAPTDKGGTNNNNWNESRLNKTNLNINYLNNLGTEWAEKIVETTWNVGGGTLANIRDSNAKIAYDYEVGVNKIDKTYNAKIGLMYVSEYAYAAYPTAWTTKPYDYYNANTKANNWMYMGFAEWTISPLSGTTTVVFRVGLKGNADNFNVYSNYGVRPSFNLESSVELLGGSGSKTDPMRIR